MRILHIIQKKQLRGAEVFASQLSQHLLALGHTVRIVSLDDGDANLPFSGGVSSLSVQLKKRFWDRAGWKKLADAILEFEPDVVQANAGDTLKYAVFSKILFRWKAPIIFRNASMVSAYIRSRFAKAFNGFLLKRVTHVASVSEASRADLVKTFPFLEKKTTVIPGGIEEKHYTPIAHDPNDVYLVHVGGFSFEKNHRGLLRIFRDVLSVRPTVRMWLVGDGVLRKEIEAYAQELSIAHALQFQGYQPNVLDYISAARVLLLPSIIEGLPGVVMEAFYVRTVVVANRVGGVGELVESGRTGWLIERDDEKEFAKAVLSALDKPEQTALLTERAHALVREKYMNEFLAKRFEEVYQNVVISKR
ncbi:glycosyltransferase [Chryseolinea lacunae]|uniref:Glycosyltransferase n=1 Tax=Chryseolinea lacunae TaxID=2801331 RepID=A0ABS1KZB8_9BACT|nr:glycosyltransferase [Chryseolinea lacunae]MBL0744022.1 glycosyltransferase [Chryseolinea lacunae]